MDELDISRLLAEYCHRCDDGDFAAVAGMFTADGTFEFGRRSLEGREAIAAGLAAMQPANGKHLSTNLVVEVDGDDASAVSDFVFLVKQDGGLVPLLAGRYLDELRRDGGTWRFHRRRADTL